MSEYPTSVILAETLALSQLGRDKEVLNLLEGFLRNASGKGPEMADLIFVLGKTQYRLGRYEDAIVSFKGLYEGFPKDEIIPDARLHTALCYINLKEQALAKEVLYA